MDYRKTVHVPQLSNEMQLNVMNWVKSGKMSIDEVLVRANNGTLHKQRTTEPEEKQLQYNFSVRKFNRYIWQKRVLQVDFSTSLLCSIEKGIVKRQLCFSEVKNCHDAPGTRFSISFRDRSDYELEAASLEDKQQIMQLVNQVIYSNIYSPLVNGNSVEKQTSHLPPTPDNLKEGHLLLQRGGLASFKWKKYEAYLQTGQLTLFPDTQNSASSDAGASVSFNESVWSLSDIYSSVDDVRCAGGDGAALVIHLSDGKVRVDTPCNADTFTLHNDKNDFVFRIPKSDRVTPEAVTDERDAWVKAIKQLSVDWKQKSRLEHFYEAPEKDVTGPESKAQDNRAPLSPPPVPHSLRPRLPRSSPNVLAAFPAAPESESASRGASEAEAKPALTAKSRDVLKPERTPSAVPVTSPPAACSSPAPFVSPPPSAVPGPVPPAPLPPPLPVKSKPLSERTKAFHWDLVAQDKIEKSMWSRRNPRKIEIDTSRLYELFGAREMGRVGRSESISTMEIMLNSKIAHNFNIFLKSFPVHPKELKDKLLIINEEEGGLSDEHIASLRRYVPTPDDIEMYKLHKGDPSELHVVDQYMMELIIQKIRMCQQLWACESFVSVLEYLLAVGNYLNQNAGKDRAKGFRLSSLTKLSQLRGNNRKFTLLHALVEQIVLREPRLATFFLELAEFDTVPGASVKGLTAEVDVVRNEFQKIVQYKKTYSKSKNEVNEHPKFIKDLKTAIEKHEADLRQLMKRCEEMRKLYTDILIKFGEPLDQDSQEVFGWICQFISDFKKAYSEHAQ
ncbi:formin-like protein 3 isoform X2 [Puntigrus tetrazona]|uniref:formin-like protein 3 isoform X2 n=1 Tax=Puntigrus tetrazona TaxID=1606681 RepID=UPI001C88E95A|nr:formin-like protein 3 isoform X2 [Puntigrus tetrazona]